MLDLLSNVDYDPVARGAKCTVCPLAEYGPPVAPEDKATAEIAIVGEAPSEEDASVGQSFVGKAGQLETYTWEKLGIPRTKLHVNNALLCRPPNNELDKFLAALRIRNKKRVEAGLHPHPSPMECCAPRLHNDLKRFDKIVTLGGTATNVVVPGMRTGIVDIRGGPILLQRLADSTLASTAPELPLVGTPVKVLPTLHPSFVLRVGKWKTAYTVDHERALRFFSDTLTWTNPDILLTPSPEQLAAYLSVDKTVGGWVARAARGKAWDVETDALESMTARLRCIGFGDPERAVVFPILGIDGSTSFYDKSTLDDLWGVTDAWLQGPAIKIGWNSGSYDNSVLRARRGYIPAPTLDLILAHRLAWPENSHSLGYVGSIMTDVHRWKAGKDATTTKTDVNLHIYNGIDCAVTARVAERVVSDVRVRKLGDVGPLGPTGLLAMDHKIQAVCCDMHVLGMKVDQVRRRLYLRVQQERSSKALSALKQIAHEARGSNIWGGSSKNPTEFNPNSPVQVSRLLYDIWMLPVLVFTEKSGTPSVGDEAIRKLLQTSDLPPRVIAFLNTLRDFRKAAKIIGTYLIPLTPAEELDDLLRIRVKRASKDIDPEFYGSVVEELESGTDWWDLTDDQRDAINFKYHIAADGRIHPDWKAHVVVTGRLASSPNLQNWLQTIRSMIIPEEGNVFVYADSDQLELRIAAARWGAARYLAALKAGEDPHQTTMHMIFGDRMWALDGAPQKRYFKKGISGQFETQRTLAKKVQYAAQYGALTPTVYDIITSSEDKYGRMIFATLTMREVAKMHKTWLKNCPEFTKGWDTEMALFRRDGYITEPICGRRREFLNGEAMNEIVNFPIQSSGASVINTATLAITGKYPRGFAGKYTGLINQCHDALTLEVPEAYAMRVAYDLRDAMTGVAPAYRDVEFKAEAKIKGRWEWDEVIDADMEKAFKERFKLLN